MDEHLHDFIIYIASEKALAQNTVEAYRRDINFFIGFLEEQKIVTFEQVTESLIVGYLAKLKTGQYAESSIIRALVAIKVFFRFLVREKILVENPGKHLESPKLWQLLPSVLSLEEMKNLLAQPDISGKKGLRDKALMEILYSSGLRVSEVCKLKLKDVDDDYVKVFGKGSKERLVPIGHQAIEAVDAYLKFHQHPELLFPGSNQKPISRVSVWNIVKKYAKQAGIQKNIFPHTFRHTFATHLLENGADLRVIQEMLGHSNINSTDRYTHVDSRHLKECFNKFGPVREGPPK